MQLQPAARILGVTIVLVGGAVEMAAARDLYVDNVAGDDRFTGRREKAMGSDGPVRSLARALRLARAEDRITLANTGVPYRESVSLVGGPHSGASDRPFLIEGNGATLDGRATVPPDAWENYRQEVFRFRPPRLGHQQLYLDGMPARFHPPKNREGAVPKLDPLEWTLTGGYLYFRIERERMIGDYDLAHTHQTVGITLYRVHDVLISNLTIEGFQLDGVNVFDDVRDCRLFGLTARGNGRSGIAVGNASRVELIDCLVGDNGEAQVLAEGLSFTALVRCELLDNTAPSIVRRGGVVLIDGRPYEGDVE